MTNRAQNILEIFSYVPNDFPITQDGGRYEIETRFMGHDYMFIASVSNNADVTLNFWRDGTTVQSKDGSVQEAFYAMSMMARLIEYVRKRHPIEAIRFKGHASETSRTKLYAHLAQRIASKVGGDIRIFKLGSEIGYRITVPRH